MKTKQEILTALAHSGDDKLLLAGLLDKEQTCEQRGYLTHTKFLDLKQRALCTDAVRLAGATGHALFWGGYEDAERGIYLFYPDYMDAESAKLSAPLALLRARKRREDTLTHRDYLGSLMGLQIDRSVVGDILVHEEGADIIVLEDMAVHPHALRQAGRKQLSLTREDLSDLKHAAVEEKRGTGSVASPRLDASVAALIFGLPRKDAQARIEKGLVFVNNTPCMKPEHQITEGDRLTVRGVGHARVKRSAAQAVRDEFSSNMSEMRKYWQNVSGKACCQAGLSMLYFRQYQTIKAAALYGNFVS
ncbi:MAG: YlmH/Sll1252 family protein [Butyricicoccus sp.]